MLLISLSSPAQDAPAQSRTSVASDSLPPGSVTETPHLTLTTAVAGEPVAPGTRVSLLVDITPKPKMHVYAPQQKEYIPLSITLDPNSALTAQRSVFPKPEKLFFAPLKETQLVYSKPFRIVLNVLLAPAVRTARDVSAGELKVTGRIRYQACDDAICYLPKDVPVSWTIRLKSVAVQ